MEIAIWIAQVALAIGFAAAGVNHIIGNSRGQAAMAWLNDLAPWQRVGIGALEVLGAIGLIMPAVTGIAPWLVWVAAACLVLLMLAAVVFHVARNERPQLIGNVVLGAVAAFVFIGRVALAPLGS